MNELMFYTSKLEQSFFGIPRQVSWKLMQVEKCSGWKFASSAGTILFLFVRRAQCQPALQVGRRRRRTHQIINFHIHDDVAFSSFVRSTQRGLPLFSLISADILICAFHQSAIIQARDNPFVEPFSFLLSPILICFLAIAVAAADCAPLQQQQLFSLGLGGSCTILCLWAF